jgi:hypothetical protein
LLGLKSCITAAQSRAEEATLGWISFSADDQHPNISRENMQQIAYFLDQEILRVTYYYPILFTHARMWRLEDGKSREIEAARLYVSNIDFSSEYIDIVNIQGAQQYIRDITGYVDRSITQYLSSHVRKLKKLKWIAGQAVENLENSHRPNVSL